MIAGVNTICFIFASETFLGGKELPKDHCYCLLPSLDTAKWRHGRKHTRSITRVGLAEQSIEHPVRAKTAFCRLQKNDC